jgi:hypothetical protein
MNTGKTSIHTIALFFMAITLVQSCVVYQKNPVGLLQAEQSQQRVKLKTSAEQTFYFEQIVLEENQFYGLKKEKRELVPIVITDDGATDVFLHSKRKSTIATIGIILVPLIGLIIYGRTMTFDSGLEF